MEWLIHLITGLGIVAILAVIYAESGLLVGFFLPGDSLLFAAGFLVSQNILHINIHLFVLLLFAAAVLGDNTGYAFGSRVGRKLFERKDSRLFHQGNLRRAEAFYEKHGAKTIVLARFVPVVRTFAPIIAGVSKMRYREFLIFNLIGSALWVASFTYLGYYAGGFIERLGINIEIFAIFIVLLSILPGVVHVLRQPEARAALKRHACKFRRK